MERVLVSSGAAFVSADPEHNQWTIGNDAVCKTLAWREDTGLYMAALEHRTTGHIWRTSLDEHFYAGGEFVLYLSDTLLSGRQAKVLHGAHAEADGISVTLCIDLRIPDCMDVRLCCRVRPDTAVFEQWIEVALLYGGAVARVAPLIVHVIMPYTPTHHWIEGLHGHGAGMPESGPYPAFRLVHRGTGAAIYSSGVRSTWNALPWFALDGNVDPSSRSSEGLFVGLRYSGRWMAVIHGLDAVGGALELAAEGFSTSLQAGERWTSPTAFLGLYHGDLDAAAHVQHTYMRRAVVPPTPEDFPWVQYNTWFAHLVDIDEAILHREAELAAKLGAEVFVIDAGWWAPSRRTSDNFTTGLGTWQPSAEKFPAGIRAFGDAVRSLGMKFGIWVEPERVDLRQPATWRLDWLVRHHDAIVSPPWPPDTVSGWLCFGHPAVQAWAIDWISRLVADVKADWLKWDSNWWGVCTCTHHGHSATDGEWHQVQGVHIVMEELRRRFPHLIIENCAGGGVRTDFAMLANTHVTWLHDASTPSRRVRFHLAGATYLFPPELCNTWVVDTDDEPLTAPSTPRAALDAIARSRMLGAFGVSARLPEWTEAAFTVVQAAIVQYKHLRPLLKRGRFYHLLPQTELFCTELALGGAWEAYAVIDDREGAVWLFRDVEGEPVRRLYLRGLEAVRTYALTDLDTAQVIEATGAELMTTGFVADLHDRTSALLLLRTL